MKESELTVVENQPLPPRLRLLRVRVTGTPLRCEPGRFLMVREARASCDDLRIPLFPTRLDGDEITFVFDPRSRASRLGGLSPGTAMSALGPLGHPFQISSNTKALLLVGEEDAALRLLSLADMVLDRGASVVMVTWSPLSRRGLLAREWVPSDVELVAAVGEAALKSALEEPLMWAEQVCAAGSRELYSLLKATAHRQPARRKRGYAQVLWESDFMCGTGLCGRCGCAPGHSGSTCKSGPVIDLMDVT